MIPPLQASVSQKGWSLALHEFCLFHRQVDAFKSSKSKFVKIHDDTDQIGPNHGILHESACMYEDARCLGTSGPVLHISPGIT
jgi:hypothetical protein